MTSELREREPFDGDEGSEAHDSPRADVALPPQSSPVHAGPGRRRRMPHIAWILAYQWAVRRFLPASQPYRVVCRKMITSAPRTTTKARVSASATSIAGFAIL